MMMYAQYCRIESRAGGVGATDRQFIRAALSTLAKPYRYKRTSREVRHGWLREGLRMLGLARNMYCSVMSKSC